MKMTQTTHTPIVSRVRRSKRVLVASENKPKTQITTPTVMFCGSPYNLKLNRSEVYAVDLDGTLAELFIPYDPRRIGKPLMPMVNQVKKWLQQGKKVVVLTARLNSKEHTPAQIKYTHALIRAWTKKYIGTPLPSTSEKHHLMTKIFDDRAVSVDPKTGRIK